MLKDKRIILIALYGLLAIYLLPMFPHGGSANELTRWATAASLIEKGSFEISWTEPLIGKNVDTAVIGGKTYSNKAPGPALLGAPFYALTRIFIGPPDALNIRISWFVMRFALSTLPLLLLAIWLYRKDADEFSLATLLFATPLFVYSLLFFGHALAAILLYFAFRLLHDDETVTREKLILAGALAGTAVISEFPVVFAVAVLGIGVFFKQGSDRYTQMGLFAVGGLPFALILLLYNNALFGSPFSFSYAHESFPEWAEVAGRGFLGINVPSISNAYLLLFSPSRGLLFFSPVLILALIGLFDLRKKTSLRDRIKIAVIVVTFLIICGHGAAHGGWAFASRYLVCIVPFLVDGLFDGDGEKDRGSLYGLAFAVSLIFCTLPALTFPFAPPEFTFPHNNFWQPLLLGEQWFTPNLLNVFGMVSVWTLIPAILALLAVVVLIVSNSRRPRIFAAGLTAGAVIAFVYIMAPGLDNEDAKFRRATIAERFFTPANRMEPFREQAMASNDIAMLVKLNEFDWAIADARANAPDDFPYLKTRNMSLSPSAMMKKVAELQKQGKSAEAEMILRKSKTDFPYAACELSVNLAVIYYTSNRKDQALAELESVQGSVSKASPPGCIRSQFLLGTAYRELGRNADSDSVLGKFLVNSENTTDATLKDLRKQLQK